MKTHFIKGEGVESTIGELLKLVGWEDKDRRLARNFDQGAYNGACYNDGLGGTQIFGSETRAGCFIIGATCEGDGTGSG